MSSLVVAANRGPASFRVDDNGNLVAHHGAGGLAPSLANALKGSGATWVAAALSDGDKIVVERGLPADLQNGISLQLVGLDPEILEAAYQVVANGSLWFVHHGLFDASYKPVLDRNWHVSWEGFRTYNEAFATAIMECADQNATVVVNDYHLPLVGKTLASERPDLKTVHFSHTPFATFEELKLLPRYAVTELLESMAGFGACGFHTQRWEENFRLASLRVLGIEPRTFVSALGPDAAALAEIAASPGAVAARSELIERLAGRKLILRCDRMELSKNLLRGFLAFEELLENSPSAATSVVFEARVYPSREKLTEYVAYRSEVTKLVERINSRFSSSKPPIKLVVADNFEASVAAQSCYDVLLVNALRDGMNLVAKEGPVLNDRDGVLALSTEAGAFEELGEYSLAVDPFDVSQTAHVLERALNMPALERKERAEHLRSLAAAHPPKEWIDDVISKAEQPGRLANGM